MVTVGCFTIGEHARGGELYVGQGSQMVEDSTPVAFPLGVVHKGSNVLLLAMVTDPRADNHGDVICMGSTCNTVYLPHTHTHTKTHGCMPACARLQGVIVYQYRLLDIS